MGLIADVDLLCKIIVNYCTYLSLENSNIQRRSWLLLTYLAHLVCRGSSYIASLTRTIGGDGDLQNVDAVNDHNVLYVLSCLLFYAPFCCI